MKGFDFNEVMLAVGFLAVIVAIFYGNNNLASSLKGDIKGLREELKGDIKGLREELKGDIKGLREELKGDIKGLREELKGMHSEITGIAQTVGRIDGRLEEHLRVHNPPASVSR
ncbi:MAG: hypothetical protein M1483_00785 [Actinobacteria bacterium]|nr:hypothetical protein [Actinomycetota bacterium]